VSLQIVDATSQADFDAVRSLVRAFVAWHRRTHVQHIDLIDRYFDAVAFEAELAGLPGDYAPPSGALLVAYLDGVAAGCVAMHDLGNGVAEMKRMFVPGEFRGRGVGRGLADGIIERAQRAGFNTMRLDTSRDQHDAIRLYERSGFRRVAPYYDAPDDLIAWLVFFEKDL